MVVGGSQQETLDPGFVLLGTRQQGVPVILRELVLPGGFDLVSPSFTNVGKSIVRILDISDLSTHSRHVDQIQFQEPGESVPVSVVNSNANEQILDNTESFSNTISALACQSLPHYSDFDTTSESGLSDLSYVLPYRPKKSLTRNKPMKASPGEIRLGARAMRRYENGMKTFFDRYGIQCVKYLPYIGLKDYSINY
ncbi:unnamed protein product [Schistosoma margrebowiei]|uniref:Uncharacterized protein n=1 Tax=Schistosoma margrebowiei TaxID=48269 RepID=A0A183LRE7_9TREM|nr:unnamed protein product [Schistosoma margrebowiei]